MIRTLTILFLCALLTSACNPASAQTKTPVPSMMGIFYYKDGTTGYIFNTQRSIIAQMNQRHTRKKLDSVYLCERGGNIQKPVIKKKYYFK